MQFLFEIVTRFLLSAICVLVVVPIVFVLATPIIFMLSLRDDSIADGMKARYGEIFRWLVEIAGTGGSSIP